MPACTQLLRAVIGRPITAEVPSNWVTADEAYGVNGPVRRFLESKHISYVLAVSRDHQITTSAGKIRADAITKKIPKSGWQRLSCGDGRQRRAAL